MNIIVFALLVHGLTLPRRPLSVPTTSLTCLSKSARLCLVAKYKRGITIACLKRLMESRSWTYETLGKIAGYRSPAAKVCKWLSGEQALRTSDLDLILRAATMTHAQFYALVEERAS